MVDIENISNIMSSVKIYFDFKIIKIKIAFILQIRTILSTAVRIKTNIYGSKDIKDQNTNEVFCQRKYSLNSLILAQGKFQFNEKKIISFKNNFLFC